MDGPTRQRAWRLACSREVPAEVIFFQDREDLPSYGFASLPISIWHPESQRPLTELYFEPSGGDQPRPGQQIVAELQQSWRPEGDKKPVARASVVAEDDFATRVEAFGDEMEQVTLAADREALKEAMEQARQAEQEIEQRVEQLAAAAVDEADRARDSTYAWAEQEAERLQNWQDDLIDREQVLNDKAQRVEGASEAVNQLRRIGMDGLLSTPVEVAGPTRPPPEGLAQSIATELSEAGLTYGDGVVRRTLIAHLLALCTGSIPLFAGPSGVGKSTLATAVWKALGVKAEVFPVRPGWLDSTDLLGYLDSREDRFVATPFLHVVRKATEGVPTAIVLDEFNLARVENYGADLLSQLERSRESEGGHLHLYPEERA